MLKGALNSLFSLSPPPVWSNYTQKCPPGVIRPGDRGKAVAGSGGAGVLGKGPVPLRAGVREAQVQDFLCPLQVYLAGVGCVTEFRKAPVHSTCPGSPPEGQALADGL